MPSLQLSERLIIEALAKPRVWEGQRPRCPRFAVARATRTLPLPGFASVSIMYADERLSQDGPYVSKSVWTRYG